MSVSGTLGWLTGAVFTVLSALVALTLRRQDLTTAVISPPLGYLFAVIFSAQLAVVGSSGNFWLLQATTILSGLAFNAQWVFLGTAAGLIIMVVRRVSYRKEHDPEHGPVLPSGTGQSL
jgi:prepilin signal peptidase PulO-like enzyme (type II secretory pathway)